MDNNDCCSLWRQKTFSTDKQHSIVVSVLPKYSSLYSTLLLWWLHKMGTRTVISNFCPLHRVSRSVFHVTESCLGTWYFNVIAGFDSSCVHCENQQLLQFQKLADHGMHDGRQNPSSYPTTPCFRKKQALLFSCITLININWFKWKFLKNTAEGMPMSNTCSLSFR